MAKAVLICQDYLICKHIKLDNQRHKGAYMLILILAFKDNYLRTQLYHSWAYTQKILQHITKTHATLCS